MEAPRIDDHPATATPNDTGATETARPHSAAETLGLAAGRLLAPLASLGARWRGSRLLHPTGTVCAADVVAAAEDPHLDALAHLLAGTAIVRLSGALWKNPGPPELLGLAIRFRGQRPLDPDVDPADQDLLFATVRSLWLVLPATLRTRRGDYLHNAYYTGTSLIADGVGPVELRLVPLPAPVQLGADRAERLDGAMQAGNARFRLELRRPRHPWQLLCEVRLRGRLLLDEESLQFSISNSGAGLHNAGFLAGFRRAVYAASQHGRGAT